MPRCIDDCIIEQSARLYHRFENNRGSDFARAVAVKLDVTETMKEELVGIVGAGWQVESMTIETGYGFVRHSSLTDDGMKGKSK